MPKDETLEQVQKQGRERLYPSLTNPSWLVLRKRRDLFRHWLQSVSGDALSVLDIGGRIQPYRVLLGERCNQYIAVDLQKTELVNVIGEAERLPFADEKFDVVLCTQVLEYIAEPKIAVMQMRRVLKPGGVLLLSAPAVFPQDSAVEYWRFLPGSFKHLLSDFTHVELAPEGNSLIGLIRTINVWMVTFAKPTALVWLLRFTMVPLLNVVGIFLQSVIRTTDDRFTANFSVRAQK
jgi:SAM-dependent methyltransferase